MAWPKKKKKKRRKRLKPNPAVEGFDSRVASRYIPCLCFEQSSGLIQTPFQVNLKAEHKINWVWSVGGSRMGCNKMSQEWGRFITSSSIKWERMRPALVRCHERRGREEWSKHRRTKVSRTWMLVACGRRQCHKRRQRWIWSLQLKNWKFGRNWRRKTWFGARQSERVQF